MIAIWGANGFIGRHVVQLLAGMDCPVSLLSRDFKNMPFNFSPRMCTTEADFNDPDSYCEKLSSCSTLVLAVSASGSRTYINNPEMEISANVVPYQNFFTALKQRGIIPKRIIYLSSGGAIYGKTPKIAVSENFPAQPVTPYGKAKVEIEKSLKNFCRETGGDYTILRVSNPVGTYSKKISLVPAILNCCWHGQTLNVQGNGECVRDYFDVGELADAIIKIIKTDSTKNTILNVGSGIGRSINEIIDIVSMEIKIRPNINYMPEQGQEIPYNVLDCSLIKLHTGWQSLRPLQEIIREMWNLK